MKVETIRELRTVAPFRPFQIRTASGERFDVMHPEMVSVAPAGDIVIVFEAEGGLNIIDAGSVTDVAVRKRKPN